MAVLSNGYNLNEIFGSDESIPVTLTLGGCCVYSAHVGKQPCLGGNKIYSF